MIVQCPDCTTRYELDAARVPRDRIRVRCPKCRYVFPVDGTMADVTPLNEAPAVEAAPAPDMGISRDRYEPPAATAHPTPAAPPEPARAAEPEPDVFAPTPSLDLEIERPSAAQRQSPSAPQRPEVVAEPAAATTATVDPEPAVAAEPTPASDPTDQKARRLARALVSDILVYNRDQRDKAIAEGNLVQALGQEIKKSWELYKEKVTPEVANQNNHFREALNDILADGQKIF